MCGMSPSARRHLSTRPRRGARPAPASLRARRRAARLLLGALLLAARARRRAIARGGTAVAPLPLGVGETGYSTAIPYDVLPGVPASASAREAEQAYYLRSLAHVTRRLGLPPIAPWILSDFAPDAIPPDDPGLKATGASTASASSASRVRRSPQPQRCGRSSPTASRMGSTTASSRRSETNAASRAGPVADPAGHGAAFTRETQMARTGRASARIDGAAAGTGPDAAFAIAPSDPGVRPGDRSTVTAFARAGSRCGHVRIALRWFASDGRAVGGAQSAPLRAAPSGGSGCRRAGPRRSDAAYVGIYLRAARTVGPAWFDDVSYSCARGSARATVITR